MLDRWRDIAAGIVCAAWIAGGAGVSISHAASSSAAAALAYNSSGTIAVLEAGNLTTVGQGTDPTWSPTGTNLLYITNDFIGQNTVVYVADTHGANARVLIVHAYPYINPSWSQDGKYVVYAAASGSIRSSAATVRLNVLAQSISGGTPRALGQFTLGRGCSVTDTALQESQTGAQGAYHGTPSTLIWVQASNRVVVQTSCSGQGLQVLKVGGGSVATLPAYSGGVLSPDGKTVAAIVSSGAKSPTQIGLIALSTGKTQVLSPKLGAGVLAWAPDGKSLYVATEPANPQTGSAQIVRLSKDGKTSTTLGKIQAAGAYHISVAPGGTDVVIAVVSSAPLKAVAAPSVVVYDLSTLKAGLPHQLIPGSQASWRP